MDESVTVAALEKALGGQLKKISGHLALIAHARLADEFYTKEQRTELYAAYAKLVDQDSQAYAALEAARSALVDNGIGYEGRVAKYGKEVADQQLAPVMEATRIRGETIKAVNTFKQEHKVLAELIYARETAGALDSGAT